MSDDKTSEPAIASVRSHGRIYLVIAACFFIVTVFWVANAFFGNRFAIEFAIGMVNLLAGVFFMIKGTLKLKPGKS